jgi:non-heme chloroperoxidase
VPGDDDQVVPIALSALRSAEIAKDATLKVYPGSPHGLAMLPAWKDEFHTDLLAFLND